MGGRVAEPCHFEAASGAAYFFTAPKPALASTYMLHAWLSWGPIRPEVIVLKVENLLYEIELHTYALLHDFVKILIFAPDHRKIILGFRQLSLVDVFYVRIFFTTYGTYLPIVFVTVPTLTQVVRYRYRSV